MREQSLSPITPSMGNQAPSPEDGYNCPGEPRTLVSKSCGFYPRKQSHSSS